MDRLARFSRAVRESSLKRLRAVPPGRENWRISSASMSFAELGQHLIDADAWLFRKLVDPSLAPLVGRPGSLEVEDRSEYAELLAELEASGVERSRRLARMSVDELATQVPDQRFDGRVSVWWLIVRGNLDHEIHHRGQIAVGLRWLQDADCDGTEPSGKRS